MSSFELVRVGDVARSVSDTHARRDGELIFLNTSDIERGRILHHRYSPVLSMPGQAKKSVAIGDILFSEIRPANGRWALVREPAEDFIVSTKLMVIRPIDGRIDARFLYHYLTSPDVTAWLQVLAESRSGTFPQITFNEVASLDIPLPSITEQRDIAATLGALDDRTESSFRAVMLANEVLDAMSEEAAATLARVPLADIVVVKRQTANPATLGNAAVDHFSLPAFDERVLPERVAAASIMSNKLLLDEPAVLVSRLNPRINRTWWALPEQAAPAFASTEFTCLAAETLVDLAGVWLAVRDASFREELVQRATGTSGSHQRIRPDDMLAIDVPDVRGLADTVKQKALALLDLVDARRHEMVKASVVRNALLPELFSGRLRVPKMDERARAAV